MSYLEAVKNGYPVLPMKVTGTWRDRLDQILDAGRAALSLAGQSWHQVLVVTGSSELEALRECTSGLYRAPMVLVICRDENDKSEADIEDGAQVSRMMQKAAELGLEVMRVDNFDAGKIREKFAVPDNTDIASLLFIGGQPQWYFRLAAATY